MPFNDECDITALLGKTLVEINIEDDEIKFVTESGETFLMYHCQDGDEIASIENVRGNLADLIGTPILLTEDEEDSHCSGADYYFDGTSTFYKLATIKGGITICWLVKSNGDYSEHIDFKKIIGAHT